MLIISFIFKARLLIFWVIGHTNVLIEWHDFYHNRTMLSPVSGCGSLKSPIELSGPNSPWLSQYTINPLDYFSFILLKYHTISMQYFIAQV